MEVIKSNWFTTYMLFLIIMETWGLDTTQLMVRIILKTNGMILMIHLFQKSMKVN